MITFTLEKSPTIEFRTTHFPDFDAMMESCMDQYIDLRELDLHEVPLSVQMMHQDTAHIPRSHYLNA